MRRTKIICTLGPATDNEDVLRTLIANGMDVARLNFSHGTHAEHEKRADMVKKLREELGRPVALMLDTRGPEIRLGCFKGGRTLFKENSLVTLTADECEGDCSTAYVNCKILPEKVAKGTHILIDDGLIQLRVEEVSGNSIVCRVLVGGEVSDNKSVNVPGLKLGIEYLRQKDIDDIKFAIKHDFDYIAASFARSAADIFDVKRILEENGGADIQVIAKIENSEGIENLDEIIKISDGIMIARGDMGVEIPFEELPRLQKMIIKKVYSMGKKSITATQMLDSMIKNPRPTRAEATDVANAVYDGTSAVMLSGETSIGRYPVESFLTMCRIIERTESDINYKKRFNQQEPEHAPNVTDAISHATCTTAHDLGAAAIITVTKTGNTARMVSKYRPACPIIGCTTDRKVYRQLALSWGVLPVIFEEKENTDDLFEHAVEQSMKTGIVKSGDLVVITAGVPLGVPGTTNILKVHIVGHVLVSGTGITQRSAVGTLCVCKTEQEALSNFNAGEILVIPETSNNLMKILKKARGIITEKGGAASHAATVGLLLDIPVICGAEHATDILKSGTTVTIDGLRGLVYSGVTRV